MPREYIHRQQKLVSTRRNSKVLTARKLSAGLAVSAMAFASSTIYANGYYLPEQNVSNLGTSYAGTASLAEDASINFYNAAGLTRLGGKQLVAGGILANADTTLEVASATSNVSGTALPPNTVKPFSFAAIPFFHYSQEINKDYAWGMSVVSTFGSKTNFPADSVARYVSTTSKLLTVDFAPSFAYQLNDKLSLGVGVDIVYVSAILNAAYGTGSTATDGFADAEGHDTATGMHMGLLYEANDNTRLGLNYRSMVRAKARGMSYTKVSAGSAVIALGVRAVIDFPEMVTASAYHAFNDKWAIMGDAQWFHWSRIQKVTLEYSSGAEAIFNYNYKNSYRVALGGTYNYNDKLQFKGGLSFDKTPTKDGYRTIAIPDQDQIGVGLGLKYAVNKAVTLDFGYAHIFARTADINLSPPTTSPASLNTLVGKSRTKIDAIGAQVTWSI